MTKFHADVPQKLIAILRKINYRQIADPDGEINKLHSYVQKERILPLRHKRQGDTIDVPKEIPTYMVRAVNTYDFSNVSFGDIMLAEIVVRQYVKKHLPMVES